MKRVDRNRDLFVAASAALASSSALLAILAATNHLLARRTLPLLAVAALAGAAALYGWWRERHPEQPVVSDEERIARLEAHLRAREEELARVRAEETRAERAREAEHRWNLELRQKLNEIRLAHGPLGDTSDTRRMVLLLAMRLLGAQKGLLISRDDMDADGDLDLVCAEGFEHDPRHSAVVQRFANAAVERNKTIREDDVGPASFQHKTTDADREIKNLVAIPMYMADKFDGVVVACNKPGGFHDYDDEILLALGDQAGAVLQNARLHGELRGSYLTTVSMLAEAIEVKDPFLRGHSNEVSEYVAAVAERLHIDGRRREELAFGSLLHDIGKLGISERILLKPGPLSQEERSIVQLHPRIGYRLIQQVPALRGIAPAVLHHHERWDGSGYPAGLKGEEIPLEARIICVADSYSAMTSQRPYTQPLSPEEACAELERCAGTQFDPEIVRLFCAEVRKTPPSGQTPQPLAAALDDPELELRRKGDEPLFGYGSFEVIDNLTLLYCHRYAHELASSEAERARVQDRPFGVVLVRIMDIERVNREQGYAMGDASIQFAARAVQRAAGNCGGTAVRMSGRTLGVIIPGADEESAESCAEEIGKELAQGPATRCSTAAWRPGDSGEDVIARAESGLGASVSA
jgi:diguanylate cyclase (GGDEF)-like protein